MKRMKHEKHGFTHAENTVQEAYLRNLGWVQEDEELQEMSNLAAKNLAENDIKTIEEAASKRGRPKKV